MPYELAKELKDAGFPQKSDYGFRGASIISYHRDVPLETDVRIPTLEELIERVEDILVQFPKIYLEYFVLWVLE
jgi:hypothetical protein